MTVIVRGIYKQGRIELLETPTGLSEGRVRVVVSEEAGPETPCLLPYGKYRSATSSTLEDFKEAEWHGEEEFDNPHGS